MAQVPGAPVGPPPAAHVQLMRHPDGRHAVMDAAGNVLGLHNSLASAQRHMADYYEPQGAVAIPENTYQPVVQRGAPNPGAFAARTPETGWNGSPMGAGGFQAGQQAAYQEAESNPAIPVAGQQAAYQRALAGQAQAARPASPYGLGGHPGPPTRADLIAGMQFGAANPGYNPHAAAAAAIQDKMIAQHQAARQVAMRQQAQKAQGGGR